MTIDTATTDESADQITPRGERALNVVRKLLELSQVTATISVSEEDDSIHVEVAPESDDDATLLIGPQGHTLTAYQFITNRIVNRFPEDRKPISIDIAGYVARHRERLAELAIRIRDGVTQNDIEVSIAGMNPADRRTVHMALSECDGIDTFSNDEGIARRIVVTPSRK